MTSVKFTEMKYGSKEDYLLLDKHEKIYINGTRQTVVATNDGSGLQDFADEDQTVASFQDGEQRWGATVDDSYMAHIYLAECNGVDGLALDASYFGETKNSRI